MLSTILTLRRARAGKSTQLLETALRSLDSPANYHPARLRLRMFQGRHRPDLLLILSDWTTRDAGAKYLATNPNREPVDELCVRRPTPSFYHPLSVYEEPGVVLGTASCTYVHCRRAAIPAVLDFLLEGSGEAIRQQAGLLLHALYQDEDRPNYFLSLRGWTSEAAMETSFQRLGVRLDADLAERGAKLTHFRGRAMLDLRGPSASSNAEQPPATE
jgi:hypothetical protein